MDPLDPVAKIRNYNTITVVEPDTKFTLGDDVRSSPTPPIVVVTDPIPSSQNNTFEYGQNSNLVNANDPQNDTRLYTVSSNINRSITPASRNSSGDCLIPKEPPTNIFQKAIALATRQQNHQQAVAPNPMSPVDSVTSTDDLVNKNGNNNGTSPILVSNSIQTLRQLLFPFLVAGLGNVAAGIILADVQHWEVFMNLPQLIILVPALIGLKGNVEMTLASRLSTHANLGHMDDKDDRKKMIWGNMALVQCQASTVGFIAPLVAVLLSMITSDVENDMTTRRWLLLISSSVITANIANLFLGSVMCLVVLFSRKYNINPDNIATPIAASLGDFTTLFLLAHISKFLYDNIDMPWIQNSLLIVLMLLIPLWAYIARINKFTRSVILTGWFPILGAMLLQNTGGLIMEQALEQFDRVAVFQPVINGIAGNIVAIQSSRMSTYLHQSSNKKQLPETDPKVCIFPLTTFFNGKSPHSSMARLLLLLSVPTHIIFILVIKLIRGQFELTPAFLIVYLTAVVIQISILLYMAYCLVHWIWKRGFNPDNVAIPFLTALADLIGSALLAVAFVVLYQMNDPNAITGELSSPNLDLIMTGVRQNTTIIIPAIFPV